MSTLTYLPVSHEEVPVRKIYAIDGINYTVDIMYNDVNDFYTFAIVEDDEALFVGKLVYCENVFDAVVEGIPEARIIPLIIEDVVQTFLSVDRVKSENFDSVRLCLL